MSIARAATSIVRAPAAEAFRPATGAALRSTYRAPAASQLLSDYARWSSNLNAVGVSPHTVVLEPGAKRNWLTAQSAMVDGVPRVVLRAEVTGREMPAGLRMLLEDSGAKQFLTKGDPEATGLSRAARPLPTPASGKSEQFQQALVAADGLLRSAGVSPASGDRQLMRFTLARHIFDGLTPESLAHLAGFPGGPSRADIMAQFGPRARFKVERLLATPYTQNEAFQRMDHFEDLFRDLVSSLKARAKGAEYQLHLGGSTVQGRYSAASDLDLYIDTADAALRQAAITKQGVQLSHADRMDFQVAAARNPHGVALGDGTRVLKEPGWFRRIFAENAERFGLSVDLSTGTSRIAPTAGERVEKEVPRHLDNRLVRAGPPGWSLRSRYTRLNNAPESRWLTLERLEKLGGDLLASGRQEGFTADALRKGLAQSPDADPHAVAFLDTLVPTARLALDWTLASKAP